MAAMCPPLAPHPIESIRRPDSRPSSGTWVSAASSSSLAARSPHDRSSHESISSTRRPVVGGGVEAEAGLGRLLLEDDEPRRRGELGGGDGEAEERHVDGELAAERRQDPLAARRRGRRRAGDVDDRAGVAGEQLAAHEDDQLGAGARAEV